MKSKKTPLLEMPTSMKKPIKKAKPTKTKSNRRRISATKKGIGGSLYQKFQEVAKKTNFNLRGASLPAFLKWMNANAKELFGKSIATKKWFTLLDEYPQIMDVMASAQIDTEALEDEDEKKVERYYANAKKKNLIVSFSEKDKKYEAIEKMIINYIQKKYKPYTWENTSKSDTNFGKSWYIKFSKGSVFNDTYEDFAVRLSDHATGINRGSSKKHVFVSSNFYNEESVKKQIDDFLNPGEPQYKYEKAIKLVEGSTIERAIHPWNPSKTKYKEIEKCIRKNKKGECINKYEVEYNKPILVGVKRPKWKG
jgi:hypothetical protein